MNLSYIFVEVSFVKEVFETLTVQNLVIEIVVSAANIKASWIVILTSCKIILLDRSFNQLICILSQALIEARLCKTLIMTIFTAFRSHKAKKASKKEQALRQGDREGAAVLIQSYVRMWQTRVKYLKLQDFKFQKEVQLSLFAQQVNQS